MEIVKVKYILDGKDKLSFIDYAYYTEEPLEVGDLVNAPVKNGNTCKAKVIEINVPESEVENFKESMRTLPAGSVYMKTVELGTIEYKGPASPVEQVAGLFDKKEEKPVPEDDDAVHGGDDEEPLSSDEIIDETLQTVREGYETAEVTAIGEEEPVVISLVLPPGTALINVEPESDPRVIALYEEVQKLLSFAEEREIKTVEDLEPAGEDLGIISKLTKAINEKRKEYLDPINNKADIVRNFFKTLLEPLSTADEITRKKVKAFNEEQNRKAAEAQRVEDEKLEKAKQEMAETGEHHQDLNTTPVPPPAPARVHTSQGTVGGREVWKYEIIDFSKLSDDYKLPNTSMLNTFAKSTKGTKELPGVRIYSEREVTVRAK